MHVLMLAPDCFMIDRRILQQARSLRTAGYRVTLISGFECPQEEHYVADGIDIHRYQYDWDDERLKRIRAALPQYPRLIRWVNHAFMFLARRGFQLSPFDVFILSKARQFAADVVHVHDLPCLKHGVRLAAEWGVPLVFDAHEIYPEQESLLPRVRRSLQRQERRGLRCTSLFITVNQAIADWYQAKYGIKPLVLMNCADSPAAPFGPEQHQLLQATAGLGPQTRIVLFQGWISAERNLATLVRSAEHFPPDTHLLFIGYGEYEKQLRALVDGQPWGQRVHFLGRIEPEHILALTAGADLGVIPYQPVDLNHQLCSPNKFFEYVQAGVPVIAQDLVFFREMGRKLGVVAVGELSTVQGMTKAINTLLADQERLASMRRACREAAKTLNWEVEGRKLVDAYATITGGGSRCGSPSST